MNGEAMTTAAGLRFLAPPVWGRDPKGLVCIVFAMGDRMDKSENRFYRTRDAAPQSPEAFAMLKILRETATLIGFATSAEERMSHERKADAAQEWLSRLIQEHMAMSEALEEFRKHEKAAAACLPVLDHAYDLAALTKIVRYS